LYNIRVNVRYVLWAEKGGRKHTIKGRGGSTPKFQLYLSREEHGFLKRLADERGVSMKDAILQTIKDKEK